MNGYVENQGAYDAAVKGYIIRNARTTFLRTAAVHVHVSEFLNGYAGSSKFINEMKVNLNEKFGKLSAKQVEIMCKIIADDQERRMGWEKVRAEKLKTEQDTSKHIGEVGDKVTLTLKCERIVEIRGPAFSHYDTGITYLHICKDQAGNVVNYKGKAEFLEAGMTGDVVCRVKAHGLFKEVANTYIARPKILFIHLPTTSQEK